MLKVVTSRWVINEAKKKSAIRSNGSPRFSWSVVYQYSAGSVQMCHIWRLASEVDTWLGGATLLTYLVHAHRPLAIHTLLHVAFIFMKWCPRTFKAPFYLVWVIYAWKWRLACARGNVLICPLDNGCVGGISFGGMDRDHGIYSKATIGTHMAFDDSDCGEIWQCWYIISRLTRALFVKDHFPNHPPLEGDENEMFCVSGFFENNAIPQSIDIEMHTFEAQCHLNKEGHVYQHTWRSQEAECAKKTRLHF